jgi:ABC-2 type transport system ATP-binding protein
MAPIIDIRAVTKTYKSGLTALHPIDLAVQRGEIFALLGPNGAGKTTLISIICGTVTMTSGQVLIAGHDIVHDYRAARRMIGCVTSRCGTNATPASSNCRAA